MSRDKNAERIATKEYSNEKKRRRNNAFNEGFKLLEYTEEVKKKVTHNKNFVI